MTQAGEIQLPPQTRVRRPFTIALALVTLAGVILSGQLGLLALATFVSEDLTCIAAGQLVRRGDITLPVGITGCFIGIFVGDVGLWLLGRLVVRRIISWPMLARFVAGPRVERARRWLNGRVGSAIFISRFIPGMRLPVYVAMGAADVSLWRFAGWTFVAASLWTPLLVLLVAFAGDAIIEPLRAYLGTGWVSLVLAIAIGTLLIRLVTSLATELGRARLVAKVSKIWRWEFWPSWLFYLPLLPWIGWLSLRNRGFLTITAANPGIPHGGFVGESKHQILSSLDSPHVIDTALLRGGGDVSERLASFDRIRKAHRFHFPLILKPDAGQRGAGVKLARTRDEVTEYLAAHRQSIIVQPFHPGPFEAGIFYYRIPGEQTGHILSITDKHFSKLIGDGESTLEQLIWRHRRYRMQAAVFLTRHAAHAHRVLGPGEQFRLAVAGNHCQGTMFCDGSHLITPPLEQVIDRIAASFPGFFFGRFDVRYGDVEAFKAGKDLTVIELNGVTSESTNLYDPSWSLWRAYSILFQQWSLLFRIAAANRAAGVAPSSLRGLLGEIFSFYREPQISTLAD